MDLTTTRHGSVRRHSLPAAVARWIAEVALITCLFAAAGAWPVPDLNEPVYLTKARHAADPSWAAGDFFLETPDAHGIFYRVFGPLAAEVPLAQAAWLGRIAGWLAVAIGFRHVIGPLAAGTVARLAAAALFAVAVRCTPVAGEWVIGGCEAKVFAWACVFGGLGEFLRGRPATAWLAMGCGAAFHPLVGGWAMIALVPAWAFTRGDGPAASLVGWSAAACLVGGLLAAAAGVLPALGLSAGATGAERAAAARIYVVERLPHHLLPRAFAEPLVARHLLAIAAWWLLTRIAPPAVPRRRLDAFTLVALGVSLAGLAIASLEPFAPAVAHGLLRFYWFRLADVLVPLALTAAVVAVLANASACVRLVPVPPAALRWAVAALLGLDLAAQSAHWPLPGRQLAARADAKLDAAAWADVCGWVREHTPADARFLTPRGAGSFTWRTDRAEVVSWKNSPQDAASLIEWRQRIVDVFSPGGRLGDLGASVAARGPEGMAEVAAKYAATHAIVPVLPPWQAELPFERLYANEGYAVYRVRFVTDTTRFAPGSRLGAWMEGTR